MAQNNLQHSPLGRCLRLLLRIRSAGWWCYYNKGDIIARFKTMRRKQDLAISLGKYKKEIGGNHAFFRDNIKAILWKKWNTFALYFTSF